MYPEKFVLMHWGEAVFYTHWRNLFLKLAANSSIWKKKSVDSNSLIKRNAICVVVFPPKIGQHLHSVKKKEREIPSYIFGCLSMSALCTSRKAICTNQWRLQQKREIHCYTIYNIHCYIAFITKSEDSLFCSITPN